MNNLKKTIILFQIMLLLASKLHTSEVSFEEALKEKKLGHFHSSELILTALSKSNPSNSEYWFQLGLVCRFQNKLDDALLYQKKAQSISPHNTDITLELARIYYAKGDFQTALTLSQSILMKTPTYTEAQELIKQIEQASLANEINYRWQLDAGYELSQFSRQHQPDWHSKFVQLGYWLNPTTLTHIRLENSERFKTHNESYEIGWTKLIQKHNASISIGNTPASTFIPRWRIKSYLEYNLAQLSNVFEQTWLTGFIQYDEYTTLSTWTYKPGIKHNITPNIQIHGEHINVIDENDKHLKGWSARINWQTPFKKLRMFLGLSKSPETDLGITVDTKSKYIGFSYQLNNRTTWHIAYTRDDREDSFVRRIVTTAISIKF